MCLHKDLLSSQDGTEDVIVLLALTGGRARPFKGPIRTNVLVYIIHTARKQTADISRGEQRKCGAAACGHKQIKACKTSDPVCKSQTQIARKDKGRRLKRARKDGSRNGPRNNSVLRSPQVSPVGIRRNMK